MASYWVDRGCDVSVVTLVNTRADFHRLPPGVTRILLPESDWPLVRTRRFLVRLFEGRELVTDSFRNGGERSPSGAGASEPGDRAPGGRRRLDGLREAYIFLLGIRDRIFGYIARHRLLGSSGAVYARVLRAVEWKVEALRSVLQRAAPDAVLSVLGATNIICTAASAGLPHRTVISERNDPSRQRLDAPWHDLRPLIYGQADAVSANSRGALEAMRAYCPPEKLCLAPNPLVLPDAVVGAARSDAVLFLARLVPQKAPDVLIEAFSRLHSRRSEWALHLAGDGPLEEPLRARVQALGLAGAVAFHGVVADPSPLLVGCPIFVLPSRFEGTPNALLEAMAHRMACIVSDASPGPLRLIEDGVSGLVVATDSVPDLAAALERLAGDEPLRRRLGEAAFERVRGFGLDRIGPIWDRILFPAGAPAPS